MVKIFYTPAGYRNATEFLLKEAIRIGAGSKESEAGIYDYSNILYLSPATVKTKEAQEIFHRIITHYHLPCGCDCYIPPETATISQYCRKVYSVYGDKRILPKNLIPVILSRLCKKGIGFSSMLFEFMGELNRLYPGSNMDTIKNYFADIFQKLNIPEALARTIMDSLDIFGDYRLLIDANQLADEDNVVNMISLELRKQGLLPTEKNSVLILDAFYDPATAEKNFLMSLIKKSQRILAAVPYDFMFGQLTEEYIRFLKDNFDVEEIFFRSTSEHGSKGTGGKNGEKTADLLTHRPGNSFVYCSYAGIEEEVEGIARSIKSLYVSGKIRDLEQVIVVFPDLRKYSAIVERVFRRYGIPSDISTKESLGHTMPFLDLLHLLNSVADGYPRLKFSQFLSSEYFTKIPWNLKKWISSLSLKSGIVSGREAWLDFATNGSELVDMNHMKGQYAVSEDMKMVFEKLQPLEDIKRGAPFNAFVRVISNILNEFGFLSFHQDSLTRDFRKRTEQLFEQMSFLGTLHPEPVALLEFIDALAHILNSSYLESEGIGVRVMGFSEAWELSPQHIFFGGLTDEDMPMRQGIDCLLPDNVKKGLGFLYLDKHIDNQRFRFYRLTKSCADIHLSYPLVEGNDMYLPSSFLHFGEKVRGGIPGIFSTEEILIRSSRMPFLNYMSEIDRLPSIYNLQSQAILRVTDVDAYRACPRKFFIEKILNLSPLVVKEYEPEAATIGNIIHKIMEKIIKEPFNDMDDLIHRTEAAIEDTMKDVRIDVYWQSLIKDTFIGILPDIYEKELEIRSGDYISTEVERIITGEPIKGIKLKGKVDRFDRIGDFVQIIDYKTGMSGINCRQALEGNENLQLFIYAAMMKNYGYKVRRVGIYSMKDINLKWCPPKKRGKRQGASGKEENNIDDYIIASLKFLEDAVNSMRKGDFRAKPLSDYTCRNCHEYAFCPYIQQ